MNKIYFLDNYDIDDDVALQPVDPRTISPSGNDIENDVAEAVEVYPGNSETEIMLNEQQDAVNSLMCEIDVLEGKRQQEQQQQQRTIIKAHRPNNKSKVTYDTFIMLILDVLYKRNTSALLMYRPFYIL